MCSDASGGQLTFRREPVQQVDQVQAEVEQRATAGALRIQQPSVLAVEPAVQQTGVAERELPADQFAQYSAAKPGPQCHRGGQRTQEEPGAERHAAGGDPVRDPRRLGRVPAQRFLHEQCAPGTQHHVDKLSVLGRLGVDHHDVALLDQRVRRPAAEPHPDQSGI